MFKLNMSQELALLLIGVVDDDSLVTSVATKFQFSRFGIKVRFAQRPNATMRNVKTNLADYQWHRIRDLARRNRYGPLSNGAHQ